jgi:hypothetical protein
VLILLALFGWLFVFLNPFLGAFICLFSGPMLLVGIIVLIVGLVVSPPQPVVYMAPTPVYVPPYPAYPAAPPGPSAQAPSCPVCRGPLTWVSQYQRNYCHHCKAYR